MRWGTLRLFCSNAAFWFCTCLHFSAFSRVSSLSLSLRLSAFFESYVLNTFACLLTVALLVGLLRWPTQKNSPSCSTRGCSFTVTSAAWRVMPSWKSSPQVLRIATRAQLVAAVKYLQAMNQNYIFLGTSLNYFSSQLNSPLRETISRYPLSAFTLHEGHCHSSAVCSCSSHVSRVCNTLSWS